MRAVSREQAGFCNFEDWCDSTLSNSWTHSDSKSKPFGPDPLPGSEDLRLYLGVGFSKSCMVSLFWPRDKSPKPHVLTSLCRWVPLWVSWSPLRSASRGLTPLCLPPKPLSSSIASRVALRTRQSGPAPEALIQPTLWSPIPSAACSRFRLAHRLCRVNLISLPATLSYFLALILKENLKTYRKFLWSTSLSLCLGAPCSFPRLSQWRPSEQSHQVQATYPMSLSIFSFSLTSMTLKITGQLFWRSPVMRVCPAFPGASSHPGCALGLDHPGAAVRFPRGAQCVLCGQG